MVLYKGLDFDKNLLAKCRLTNNWEPLVIKLSTILVGDVSLTPRKEDFLLEIGNIQVIYSNNGILQSFTSPRCFFDADKLERVLSDNRLTITHNYDNISILVNRFEEIILILVNGVFVDGLTYKNTKIHQHKKVSTKLLKIVEESNEYLKLYLSEGTFLVDKFTGEVSDYA